MKPSHQPGGADSRPHKVGQLHKHAALHNPRKMDHDLTREERKRKGGVLARHFGGAHNASKPLVDGHGRPTRHARLAARVGEPIPTKRSHVHALARKGRAMLKGLKR